MSELAWFIFQELLKVQDLYELSPLAETDIGIEASNFDPLESNVTMKLYASKRELCEWVPKEDDDQYWIQAKKMFLQVNFEVESRIDFY